MRKSLLILLGALLLLTPASAQVVLLYEDFEGGIPSGWQVFGWERNDTAEPNYAGSGCCAIADGTEHNFSTTPAILSTSVDLTTGYTSAKLEFNMSYVHGTDEAILSITSLLTGEKIEKKWTSNETGKVTINLTSYCGGPVNLAWEYKGKGGYWEIDDVKVTAETAAIPEFPGFALVLAVLASILGVLLRR